MAIPVWDDNEIGNRKYDPETGEIYPTYHKVVANKIYYDYAENGVGGYRKRLGERAQEAIDSAYNVILRERFQKEIVPMIKSRSKVLSLKSKILFTEESVARSWRSLWFKPLRENLRTNHQSTYSRAIEIVFRIK